MPKQPEAYIDFEVYENSVNYLGISSAVMPSINYITQQITGAGISGNIDAVLIGMVDAMSTTLNFRSATDSAVTLLKPEKHTLDLRVAEQHWNTMNTERNVVADKYVMVCVPKNFAPGTVAPASLADTNLEMSVTYYAGYRDGKKLWEIDPFNYICNIGGTDYMADVRKALGK